MNQKFSTGFDARPVESIARRRRSAVRRAALLAGGAVFLIALIILAALDAKLAWTPAARTALLVLAGAGALALGVQQWLRHRRGSSAADVVKLMEAQQPASGQQLRTAWEVSRKGLPSGATPESREFAGQLLAGAKQQVSSDNWSRLVPRGRVWKMLGLCGAAAAVMAVLANTWPDFRTSLRRLTMPAGAPDFTTVQWESVPSRFDDRHPPRLAVMLSGREAAPLLEVRAAGGAWEQKPLTPLPDGRLFDAVLTGLTKDFEARVTAGDGATPVHLVRYRPIPRLEEAKVTVHYPDYTGREPEERAGGDAGAVEGSTFEWQFAFNVAPDRVEWSLASENVAPQNIPMTMDGAKARARWTAPLGRFAGVLTVRDTDGEVIDSWKYAVAGAPDALPKVELLEPVKDSEATSVTELPVRIRARDDHGVAELGLVMEAAGQTIWTLEKVVDAKTDRDVTEMTRAMLETVPLTIRDNVKLYAYALDHKPRGGPRAVSALRAIDIRQFKKMTRDLGKVKGPPISPEQVVKLNEIIVAQRVVVSDCHVTKEESRNDSSSVTVKCQEIGTKQTGAQSKALLLQSAWQLEPSIPRDDVTLLAARTP